MILSFLYYIMNVEGGFNISNMIYNIYEIRQIIFPIAIYYGVERKYLFGSCARGEATSQSDLGFRLGKGAIKGLVSLGGLYSDLSASFEKEPDLLTTGSLDEKFLNEIADEKIVVYERV